MTLYVVKLLFDDVISLCNLFDVFMFFRVCFNAVVNVFLALGSCDLTDVCAIVLFS